MTHDGIQACALRTGWRGFQGRLITNVWRHVSRRNAGLLVTININNAWQLPIPFDMSGM